MQPERHLLPTDRSIALVIDDAPETVNSDCYGEGWLLKIRLADAAQVDGLLSADGYQAEIAD